MSDQDKITAQQAIIAELQNELLELVSAVAPVLMLLVEPESGNCWDTTMVLLRDIIGNGRASKRKKAQIENLWRVYKKAAGIEELPY